MAAGNTYNPIATTTFGSAVANYTFTSIPTTYTDLILVCSMKMATTADHFYFQAGNGSVDTGANYSYINIYGDGTNASSNKTSGQTDGRCTYASTLRTVSFTPVILHFMNYANTSIYKTVLSRASGSADGVDYTVNLWKGTSAINTIKIESGGNTFAIGCTLTLYGISAA